MAINNPSYVVFMCSTVFLYSLCDVQLELRFFDEAEEDCEFCDLLVCMGTSLEVYPFAGATHLIFIHYYNTFLKK